MRKFSTEERAYLWLNRHIGHNVRLFWAFCRENGPRPADVFEAARSGSLKPPRGRDTELAAKLCGSACEAYIDDYLSELEKSNIGAATLASEDYPALLANIPDPPTVLFYRGRLMDPELPIAVVGARNSTRYGLDTARSFAGRLAERGACIISGMAAGADTAAAEGALGITENKFPTIAVLGGGVDVIYPRQNAGLYEKIIARGAAVSEFAPGLCPQKGFFPMRNRIISGLSLGVLVTEAGERSGASITVGAALEQGRDTFAVPGRITDRMSAGTNRMIRDGQAAPVLSAEDILSAYGIETARKEKTVLPELPPVEANILELLRRQAESFDELYEKLDVSVTELNSALTSLEFSEIIKQLPGRVYELARNIG